MDGKVYAEKDTYPDCDISLGELVKTNPALDSAQKKIHQRRQWANIKMLYQNMKSKNNG